MKNAVVTVVGMAVAAAAITIAQAQDSSADPLKALEGELKAARGKLEAFERGYVESEQVSAARQALTEAINSDRQNYTKRLETQPATSDLIKKRDELVQQLRLADKKARDAYMAVEQSDAVVELKKKINEAYASDAALAAARKEADGIREQIQAAQKGIVAADIKGNRTVEDLRARVAELDAKVTASKAAIEAERKAAEEKKAAEKKAEAEKKAAAQKAAKEKRAAADELRAKEKADAAVKRQAEAAAGKPVKEKAPKAKVAKDKAADETAE